MNPALARKHLQAGEAFAAKGLFAQALTEFEQAFRHLPSSAEAAGNAGAALVILGRAQDSIAYFESALRLRPAFPDAEYNFGNALAALGRNDDARVHYERAIALRPAYAPAHANLGNMLLALAQPEEAAATFRRAIAADAHHAGAYNGLGIALQRLGQLGESQASYEKAATLAPLDAQPHYNLGTLRQAHGDLTGAISSYRSAIERRPDYAAAYNNLGTALQHTGALNAAVRAFARAFELDPAFAGAACNAGIVLYDLGRYDDARPFLLQAIALEPHNSSAHNTLGITLQAQGHYAQAIVEFEVALTASPAFAEAHNNIGVAARALGDSERAVTAYRQAIALNPSYADAYANLGTASMELGRFAEAERCFDHALALVPDKVRFLRGWTDVRTAKTGDSHIASMERAHQRIASLPLGDQIDLEFALGKVYADLGRHGESFDHIAAGNALKRATIEYDEAALLGFFDRVASVFTRELIESKSGSGNPSDVPVFIIGMPRSGTTLVEQILASHPSVYASGERSDVFAAIQALCAERKHNFPEVIPSLLPADFSSLGADYLRRARTNERGAAHVTDKMPSNFLYAGAIALMLPRARIIHVRRDAIDTCLSCFSRLFNEPQPHTYDLCELGRYYCAYEALMEHWRGALPGGVMLEVRYEDIVADLEAQARRIVSHTGLDWDARCLDFHHTQRAVRTASATQVRQPLYSTAIGRHRNYGDRLQPLIDALSGGRSR